MSPRMGNGNGDASRYSTVHLATRMDELDERLGSYEDRTDGLIDDMRTANAGIKSLSEELAKVGAAVIRIETRLGATEADAGHAKALAERASNQQEFFVDRAELELAEKKLALERQKEEDALNLERKRNSIRAQQDRRQVILDGVRGAGQVAGKTLLAAGPVAILVATVVLRACGYDAVGEALGK